MSLASNNSCCVASEHINTPESKFKVRPNKLSLKLMTDTKAKKNAVTTDWPNYMVRGENTLLVNRQGQIAIRKDVKE